MGRKRRIKLERRHGAAPGPGALSQASSVRWEWLLPILLAAAVVLVAIVFFFQKNQARIVQSAMVSMVAVTEQKLSAAQGNFPFETSHELFRLLALTRRLAAHRPLDARAAGQLRFVLGVIDEMLQAGDIQPGELDKVAVLLTQVERYEQRQDQGRPTPRP